MSGPLIAAVRDRLAAGDTIAGIAERAGVPRPNLSRLLAGKATVTLETADRIASAIGFAWSPRK